MEGPATTVSKGEFARILNISAARVSQYIAEGKIHGPAIDGEGRSAKIVVEVARRQLRRTLDAAQMIGNGLETRLTVPGSPATGGPISSARPPAPDDDGESELRGGDAGDPVADQIKLEKLREIRARNRRQEDQDRLNAGIYTLTADVREGMAKVAGRVLNIVEGGLASMASEIAARFQVPQRDVLHLLRLEMRKVRAAGEVEMKRASGEVPATITADGEGELT